MIPDGEKYPMAYVYYETSSNTRMEVGRAWVREPDYPETVSALKVLYTSIVACVTRATTKGVVRGSPPWPRMPG